VFGESRFKHTLIRLQTSYGYIFQNMEDAPRNFTYRIISRNPEAATAWANSSHQSKSTSLQSVQTLQLGCQGRLSHSQIVSISVLRAIFV
jgi:hypothetical protein